MHNDLNPGWFADRPDPFGINLSRNELCNYSTGAATDPSIPVHPTVRAIALLLYLHNPPWSPGDGGETGLYSYRKQPVSQPTKAIAPRNNSLFLFECRPTSYHSFLKNRNGPRNSMIMWLHRPYQNAVERWGERSIVQWTNRPKNQPI